MALKSWRNSRSWRELRVTALLALMTVCAGRASERVDVLLLKPIAMQRALFGSLIVYPWQARNVRVSVGKDGVSAAWHFDRPSFAGEAWRCTPGLEPLQSVSAGDRGCRLKLGGDDVQAEWDAGVLTLRLDTSHALQ